MSKRGEILSLNEQLRLVKALQEIQKSVHWKPGKDLVHLRKRQRMKQLPPSASIIDYEQLIFDIVRNGNNIVYLYDFSGTHFYAVRGFSRDNEWLVIFGRGGVIETAFPPENMDEYLVRRGFVLLDRIGEVLKWTR